MVNAIKVMRPRHKFILLVVGMYCVLLYFLRFSDHLVTMFLLYGLIIAYDYRGGVEEFEKIVVWQHGVRLKSLLFYGALVLQFLLCLLFADPRVPIAV